MGQRRTGCSFRIRNNVAREFLAEFLGTFVLIMFGNASVAQSVLSLQNKGDFFSINWGWGLAVLLGVLVSGGVSGGHLNPAVSVAVATLGKFPWWKVPHYLAAQYLGAFFASCLVFLTYWDALVWYEHDIGEYRSIPETAGIFSTYPAPHLSFAGGVLDQFLGTALLLACVCAITDKRNMQVSKQMVPLYIGFTVLGLGICFGYNCGYAVNPARDLAPRLFTALAGWGPGVFTSYSHWWVVPVLACHAGGVAGAWLYYLAVELHWAEGGQGQDSASKYTPAPGLCDVSADVSDDVSDDGRDTLDTPADNKYKPVPLKYARQEEDKNTLNKCGVPVSLSHQPLPSLPPDQDNTKNGSLLNLFDESEDFPPIPSPFAFGPLPPCPTSTPSPKMERIMEVTETLSSSSDTGSIPQTEVEVLEFKEVVMSPRQDKWEGWTSQGNTEQMNKNKNRTKDEIENIQEHSKQSNDQQKRKTGHKHHKEKKEKMEQKSRKTHQKTSKKREKNEYQENLQPTSEPIKDDDDVLSITSSACDCPAHVHDRESPLKVAEVRDAVLVSRSLKHSNSEQRLNF